MKTLEYSALRWEASEVSANRHFACSIQKWKQLITKTECYEIVNNASELSPSFRSKFRTVFEMKTIPNFDFRFFFSGNENEFFKKCSQKIKKR